MAIKIIVKKYVPPPPSPVSEIFSVTSSIDDGYHYTPNGAMNSTSLLWQIGNPVYETWMRFANVTIPQGATITNAFIRGIGYSTNAIPASGNIYAAAADNAVAPVTEGDYLALTTTTNFELWYISSTTAGVALDSPDLSTVVQEVVNRSGWSSGNALMFMGFGVTEDAKVIASYNHATYAPPEFHVTYIPSA